MTPRENAIYTGVACKVRSVDRRVLTSAFWPATSAGRINSKRWFAEQERQGLLAMDEIHAQEIERVELVGGVPETD